MIKPKKAVCSYCKKEKASMLSDCMNPECVLKRVKWNNPFESRRKVY